MQPYFFPYVGYFDVIRKTDQWVVFDVVKYQPKSWMNRNRILDVNAGHTYVTVPVHKGSSPLLSNIRVVDANRAAGKIRKQLQHDLPALEEGQPGAAWRGEGDGCAQRCFW